jgi:phasin family protein
MYSPTQQFAELNKAGVAQATRLAAIALENTEKLVKLNLSAAKAAFAQGVEGATAVASVKDVQELLALPTKYAETGVQSVVGYSRSLYEIGSEVQSQYSALAEEAVAGYTKGLASWVEKASASAPAGSEVAINAMKSTVAATTAAFDQFQKASKQVVSLADASVRAAADNASKAAVAPKGRRAA